MRLPGQIRSLYPCQHAVIRRLSTGVIRDIVRTYRRERSDCSIHGMPNWKATEVLIAAAATIDFDCGRLVVDAMLSCGIARHGSWFWLQGDQTINRY